MTTTGAQTSSVGGTDPFAAAIGSIFGNPQVQGSVGNAIGSVINAGLGAVGINTGKTPAQLKAQQQTTMIIGGAVAVVVVIVIIIVARRK